MNGKLIEVKDLARKIRGPSIEISLIDKSNRSDDNMNFYASHM